jgi:hypothetical protein
VPLSGFFLVLIPGQPVFWQAGRIPDTGFSPMKPLFFSGRQLPVLKDY